ncbi:MAG: ribonuclease H-like domain-containing protein [bacterium]|nr:ribonuclease H-like domain-containing protein [bacterium]
MLTRTFLHMPGISERRERDLWESGVRSWDDLLADPSPHRQRLRPHARESLARLAEGDSRYFGALLPRAEHWRLFRAFRSSVAYLDIETNGLGGPGCHVTTVALHDGEEVRCYVRDDNLRDFRDDIMHYRLVVTYNGTCFDLPFIEDDLGVRIHVPHVDLRYVLRSLGVTGGLKRCERALGIDRGELDGVDGFCAVLLWNEYRRRGDARALETLLAYNAADAVNLERLMVRAWNMKLGATPFASMDRLPAPAPPRAPFRVDGGTIARLAVRRGR